MSVDRSMATPAPPGAAGALSANLARFPSAPPGGSQRTRATERASPLRPALPDARARPFPATVLAGNALLARLAAARQLLAVPLARAAALVVAHRAWIYCGYKSQGDYTRECLHRHPRWLRDLANLHQARHAASETAAGKGSVPDDAEREDRALVSQVLPPDVKLAFETVFELHRSTVGREASMAEFVEGLVAEAMSAGCMPPGDFEPRLRPNPRVSPVTPPGPLERMAAFATERPIEPTRARSSITAPVPGDHVPPALRTPALRLATRRLAEFERLRSRLRRLELKLLVVEKHQGTRHALPEARGVGRNARVVEIPRTRRRDLRRLGSVLASLLRFENELDIAVGDLLLELHEHHAWRTLRVTGLEAYAEARLGLGRATARRRVWLARALRKLHVVRSAYEAGDIGFMATCWTARSLQGIRADAATQKLWVAHAARTTHKRQRDEERCRERERLCAMIAIAQAATPVGKSARAASDVGTSTTCSPGVDSGRDVRVNGASFAVLSGTAVALATETAHFSPRPQNLAQPAPMAHDAWHASLRRIPGEACYEVFALGYGLLERLEHGGPPLSVPLVLDLCAFDASNLSGCIEAARRQLGALVAGPLAPDDECRLGPAARLARTFVDRGQRVSDWVGLLALLEEYVLAHDRPQKRSQRSRVAERDGYRCGAPGCTSRANLQEHHLRYRSQQGGDEEANLLLLCAFHHLQGEHGGLARCHGRAPLDIVWQLGADEFATWFSNERRINPIVN